MIMSSEFFRLHPFRAPDHKTNRDGQRFMSALSSWAEFSDSKFFARQAFQ